MSKRGREGKKTVMNAQWTRFYKQDKNYGKNRMCALIHKPMKIKTKNQVSMSKD
jgi:hypothetical protein